MAQPGETDKKKAITVRFNTTNPLDRQVWEWLEQTEGKGATLVKYVMAEAIRSGLVGNIMKKSPLPDDTKVQVDSKVAKLVKGSMGDWGD